MALTVAYDLTRLFLAPLSLAPRGIDRVDLAVARFFFADTYDYDVVGILPTPWGVRAFDAPLVRAGIQYLESLWPERDDVGSDPRLAALLEHMTTGGRAKTTDATLNLKTSSKLRRLFGELRATGFALGRPVRKALPHGAVYLNIGQISLALPIFHRWLSDRSDVAAIYMLHDVIPLEYPEFVDVASKNHHRRMVETAARHADGLIVSTRHARDTVTAAIAESDDRTVPTLVRSLPLPEVFAQPHAAPPELSACNYFVSCSTVEPRKNFGLLLDAWKLVVGKLGAKAPHLVIVGSLGRNADVILRPLSEDAFLRGRVHHVSGLSSPALATLMLGSAAVLCPSLAEGFGLSLLEANSLEVPAIASDIPSHKEIAKGATILLSPDDPEGWASAILSTKPGVGRQTPQLAPELRQNAYCRDIAEFITQCASEVSHDSTLLGQPSKASSTL